MRSRIIRALAGAALIAAAAWGHTARVSGSCVMGIVSSAQGNGASNTYIINAPGVSGDGRYTAFDSASSDLVPNDTNGVHDVFVVDRETCAVERVSVDTGGVQRSVFSTGPASISDDGRYVAFHSLLNGHPHVFVRDRQLDTTVLVSQSTAGVPASIGSQVSAISGNGRFVAFHSGASNLVPGDTNNIPDIFVRDLEAGTTERVSVASDGTQAANYFSEFYWRVPPAISDDGRHVTFTTLSDNLVPNDTNSNWDVFRHDRVTHETIRVSLTNGGAQALGRSGVVGSAVSGDGRFVAFETTANLGGGGSGIYVRDVEAGTTTLVSMVNQGGSANGFSFGASISGDGRYVAFYSQASNLVPGDTNNGADVFVHDRLTSITRRVSTAFDGVQQSPVINFDPSTPNAYPWTAVSHDGRVVAFGSVASNLVPGDTNGVADTFVAEWPRISAPPNVELVRNGDFASGTSRWLQFATPDMSYIVSQVSGGAFEFYRVPPPPGPNNQAVVFQETTAQFLPFAALTASFELGNSSSVPKRISVLVHDADFGDLHVCTFWLAAKAPVQAYTMRTHTTKAWANATISFYAATAGSDGGFYRVTNVSLQYTPGGPADRTECVDPTAPAPPGGPPSGNLLTNGDFEAGLAPWGLFGQIVAQLAGGVFEFYRPPGTPAGVVLQSTGEAMTAGQILEVALDLGNSSAVRKRVTVIVHEYDFSDLMACTFWIPANTPLQTHVLRGFARTGWLYATLSIYPATVGTEPWIRLDNVVLRRTPATAIVGTECYEPGALAFGPRPLARSGGVAIVPSRGAGRVQTVGNSAGRGASSELRSVRQAGARLRYWFPPSETPFDIQVSPDGDTWHTVSVVEPSDDWRLITVDLSDLAGRVMYVRVIGRS